jgi:hypothetical protein
LDFLQNRFNDGGGDRELVHDCISLKVGLLAGLPVNQLPEQRAKNGLTFSSVSNGDDGTYHANRIHWRQVGK